MKSVEKNTPKNPAPITPPDDRDGPPAEYTSDGQIISDARLLIENDHILDQLRAIARQSLVKKPA